MIDAAPQFNLAVLLALAMSCDTRVLVLMTAQPRRCGKQDRAASADSKATCAMWIVPVRMISVNRRTGKLKLYDDMLSELIHTASRIDH